MKNIGDIRNKNVDALLNSKNIYYEGGGKTLNNIIYPIGSVVIRVDSQNPSYWYGGTWELLCPGRTMVCIDTNDSDFNVIKKTGGEKTHTLVHNEIPAHAHNENALSGYGYPNNWVGNDANIVDRNITKYTSGGYVHTTAWTTRNGNQNQTELTGGGQAHNNLQPYMVVYIWVRTK